MNWEVGEKLLIETRAACLDSEETIVRNNLCNLIDIILNELRALKDSSSMCKHLSEDLLIDRLPPMDPFVISPPPPPDRPYIPLDDKQGCQPRKRNSENAGDAT